MSYRLQCTKVHLTYKTHIDIEIFKATILNKLPPVKMWSFVHEDGDENEDNPTPYAHTHVFVWCKKNIESTNVRYFDVNIRWDPILQDENVEMIHCNIQNKRSLDWARGIVMKYHLGHKTKKNGKKYYIEPIFLFQDGTAEWKMEEDIWEIAKNAPSLEEGCKELGYFPKGLSDMKLAQGECKRRKLNPPKYPPESFNRPLMDLTLPVLLCGESDCGKTQFAKAHFKNPLIVSDDEGAKNYDPEFHDGIIFDDMTFQDWKLTKVQHLLDKDEPRNFHKKFGTYEIPANTKKIFTSNSFEIFNCKGWEGLNPAQVHSITRRYNLVTIDKPLY